MTEGATEPLGTDQRCDPSEDDRWRYPSENDRWRYPWRAYIWLIFVLIPLGNAINSHDSGIAKAAVIAATTVFVGIFVWLIARQPRSLAQRPAVLVIVVLLAIPTCLVLADGASWATLYIYVGGVIANNLPGRWALLGVGICTGLSAGTLLIIGSSAGTIIGYATPALGVGNRRADGRPATRTLKRLHAAPNLVLLRPTQSFALFRQQIGRSMRPKPDGSAAVIFDHVANVFRHGLPDAPHEWSLEINEAHPGERQPSANGLRKCPACDEVFAAGERREMCANIEGCIFTPKMLIELPGELRE